jgi:thiamine biosynthesis protein ThiI
MEPPAGADVVVVRYGDASSKSGRVQSDMEARLVENLRAALGARDVDGTVERRWTRPLVRTDAVDAAADAATDVFGVVSASPARSVPPERDAIAGAVAAVGAAAHDGGPVAVDARNAADHGFGSRDVEERAGAALVEATGADVDLDDPALPVFVEVRDEEAFVFLERRDGPGGLPLGTQAPLVALVSGGIDSPVAAYRAMRRGAPVVPVYVDLGEYGGADHRARALSTVADLAPYAPGEDLATWVVPGGDVVADLAATLDRGRMLSFRRFCLLVGAAVAEEAGASGIVTGEAVGQKSSQTVRNLAVTDAAVDVPVHRPLLTMDKQEVVAQARAIGTYDGSTLPVGCDRLAPPNPETAGRAAALREREPDDLAGRARAAVADAELVDPTA